MATEQLVSATYCIGNLFQRLCLSQPAVYAMLAESGILDELRNR